AFKAIKRSIRDNEFKAFLLHGITGSGKTEVYLQTIAEIIDKGSQALVLVPEISLTPLLVKRFKSRFGDKVGVIHSQLSEGDRFDAWRRAHRGDLKVIIGARSAIFAPLKKLGIIVVDEEHDSSYKQDEAPSYNARDMALVLGNMYSCPVVLGSATPSVESYLNASKDKYVYLSLPTRVGKSFLPEIHLVDMKNVKEKIFSPDLQSRLIKNFEDKNQSILFLNRRGFSNLLVCEGCGELYNCPNCSVTLTYHKSGNAIKCHYCGIDEEFVNSCLKCGSKFTGLGIGTQKLEQEVKALLPDARVEIMDRDTIKGKVRLLNLYKLLENKEVDVLIGTQMLAKGHDLPDVTLVGVISADLSLGIPDFRSGEKTFQLITQVAGRAGRGEKPGNVIVQTYNPEHPSIKFAVDHDSISFLKYEAAIRKSLFYPPYSKMVNFRFGGTDEKLTKQFAGRSKAIGKKLRSKLGIEDIEIIGPSESPVYRMQNRFRFQMIVKSDNFSSLHSFCSRLYILLLKQKGNIRLRVDVDPYNFM
ncbi:MAG: replication restart helicase PriA, partial [Thermodesulfobacteriota bacterium]